MIARGDLLIVGCRGRVDIEQPEEAARDVDLGRLALLDRDLCVRQEVRDSDWRYRVELALSAKSGSPKTQHTIRTSII